MDELQQGLEAIADMLPNQAQDVSPEQDIDLEQLTHLVVQLRNKLAEHCQSLDGPELDKIFDNQSNQRAMQFIVDCLEKCCSICFDVLNGQA